MVDGDGSDASGPKAGSPFVAVVDTNVLLDIYSWHDLLDTAERLHPLLGDAFVEDPHFAFRLARARESLLLGVYFNSIGARTYSLRAEPLRLLQKVSPRVPLSSTEELANSFTTRFVNFVHPRLLGNWIMEWAEDPEIVVGNDADEMLLEFAADHQLPLVTNEGYTPKGVIHEKMRLLATDRGVRAYTPAEFCRAKSFDPQAGARAFIEDFGRLAPHYIDAWEDEQRREDAGFARRASADRKNLTELLLVGARAIPPLLGHALS
jgi:hypothetical protein